jgi:hypothetical protein
VFIIVVVDFVIDSVRKLLDTLSYVEPYYSIHTLKCLCVCFVCMRVRNVYNVLIRKSHGKRIYEDVGVDGRILSE